MLFVAMIAGKGLSASAQDHPVTKKDFAEMKAQMEEKFKDLAEAEKRYKEEIKQMKERFRELAESAGTYNEAAARMIPSSPQSPRVYTKEKVAEITAKNIAKAAGLNKEETEKFIVVFCEQQKERWKFDPLYATLRMPKTEEEIQQRIEKEFQLSQKLLNLRKRYYKQYAKFLAPSQIEAVYREEKKLYQKLQDMRDERENRIRGILNQGRQKQRP